MDNVSAFFPGEQEQLDIDTFDADDIETKNSSISVDSSVESSLGNWKQEISAYIDLWTLKALLYNEDWVFIVVNFVARKISRQLMEVNKQAIQKGKIVTNPYPFHPLNDLIQNPNKFEGYTNFMYRVFTELTLMGNAIIWKLRFHEQLILLPAEAITIDFDSQGHIKSYSVNYTGEAVEPFTSASISINPEDIIHLRLPNPNSIIWGLSPFIPGRKSVLFNRYSQEYMLNYYVKQATPGMIMELGTDANEKNAIRLLKSMEMKHTGRSNQRRTMILPKGVTARMASHTFVEQNLKDHLDDNKATIMALLAIPPHAFGTQQTGSIGSDETEKQMRGFWENTGIPFQDLVSDGFTLAYQEELGKRFLYKFNNEDVAALQANQKEKAETANLMLQTHTLNEVRSKVYELEALEGGDALPSKVGAQPSFGGSFSMPQAPQQQSIQEVSSTVSDITQLGLTPESKRLRYWLQMNGDWWGKRKEEGASGELGKQQLDYLENTLDIFSRYAPKALAAFKKTYGVKAIAGLLIGSVLKDESNTDKMKKELEKAWKQFDLDYKERLQPIVLSAGETGYDLALETPFATPNSNEQAALRQENAKGRRDILEARGLESFSGIKKTTTEQILDLIASGTEQNRTLSTIAKDISRYFSEIVPSRARTIARTETLTANSLGQEAAFKDANELMPGMKKMWITLGDSRVRDSHIPLDGTEADKKSGKFANGLKFPRDPAGPAEETINCRCSLLMIPPDESIDSTIFNSPMAPEDII